MRAERLAREDDPALLAFLNEAFTAAHGPHDFARLLPKLYPGHGEHFAVREEGRIVSACGLYPVRLTVGKVQIQAAGIGAVATNKRFEGGGRMAACVNAAIAHARESGAALLFLSGDRMRYRPFGFAPGGLAYAFTLTEKSRRALPACRAEITEIEAEDTRLLAQCKELYARNVQRAERRDFYAVLRSWGRRPYAVTENGAFLGYFVADEARRMVAEADAVDAAAYCRLLYALSDRAAEVRVPPFRRELVSALAECCADFTASSANSFLALDAKAVAAAFAGYPYACNPVFLPDAPLYVFEQDKV